MNKKPAYGSQPALRQLKRMKNKSKSKIVKTQIHKSKSKSKLQPHKKQADQQVTRKNTSFLCEIKSKKTKESIFSQLTTIRTSTKISTLNNSNILHKSKKNKKTSKGKANQLNNEGKSKQKIIKGRRIKMTNELQKMQHKNEEDDYSQESQQVNIQYKNNKMSKKKSTKSMEFHVQRSISADLSYFILHQQKIVKIQKIFRGYLTRKYIKECIEQHAATIIQRYWKKYQKNLISKAKNLSQKVVDQKLYDSFDIEQPVNEFLNYKNTLNNNGFQQQPNRQVIINTESFKYNIYSLLEEILSESTLKSDTKRKVEYFLQNKEQSIDQSQQKVDNLIQRELSSQRRFMNKQRIKRAYVHVQNEFSPINELVTTPTKIKTTFIQQQHNFLKQTQKNKEECLPQELMSKLTDIQRLYIVNLEQKIRSERRHLKIGLCENKMTMNEYERKNKDIEIEMICQYELLQQKLNEILKLALVDKETLLLSPNQQVYTEQSYKNKKKRKQFIPEIQINIKNQEYQELLKENIKQVSPRSQSQAQIYHTFDSSIVVIEDYIVKLIDFLYDYKNQRQNMISNMQKPKNLDVLIILNNLQIVSSGNKDKYFNFYTLPQYKHLNCTQQIYEKDLSSQFLTSFMKDRTNQRNPLEIYFYQLMEDIINELLNSLRPSYYYLKETDISSINQLKRLNNYPTFETQYDESFEHIRYIIAQVFNQIIHINSIYRKETTQPIMYEQFNLNLLYENQNESRQEIAQVSSSWIHYEELIEIVGVLSNQLMDKIMLQECICLIKLSITQNYKGDVKKIVRKDLLDLL